MSMTRRSMLATTIVGVGAFSFETVDAAPKVDDLVEDHILREAIKHAKALAGNKPRHEALAGISSNLRLHVAHLRANKTEDKVAKALRKYLSKRGRNGVLDDLTSPERVQKHHDDMKTLGIEELHLAETDPSRADFDHAISVLSAPGVVSATLEQLADAVDEMNARNAVVAAHVMNARFEGEQIDGFCNVFNNVCHFLALFTPVICVLAGAGGQLELVPVCAILTVETATACFISWLCGG